MRAIASKTYAENVTYRFLRERPDVNPISVVIPVCLQNTEMLDLFRANLGTFTHDSIGRIIVICNRLSIMEASTLEALLQQDSAAPIQVVNDKERSVAGAWNRGMEISIDAGIDFFLISAIDVRLTSSTLDVMLRFGEENLHVPAWSSTANHELIGSPAPSVDRCDFSCVMLRRGTIEAHGWFDKEFKPAYFEDNDYATRLVLSQAFPQQVIGARHLHLGSATIKLDAEMAHHVRHWFNINGSRLLAKWGCRVDDYARVAACCHNTPYNSGKPLSWWPEQDRPLYTASGGIHE